jgi:hypothetical protein
MVIERLVGSAFPGVVAPAGTKAKETRATIAARWIDLPALLATMQERTKETIIIY